MVDYGTNFLELMMRIKMNWMNKLIEVITFLIYLSLFVYFKSYIFVYFKSNNFVYFIFKFFIKLF